MKISNFRDYREWSLPNKIIWYDRFEAATIDVTRGFLWWKKTASRKIIRRFSESWKFMDTGELTPGFDVERLADAFKLREAYEFESAQMERRE